MLTPTANDLSNTMRLGRAIQYVHGRRAGVAKRSVILTMSELARNRLAVLTMSELAILLIDCWKFVKNWRLFLSIAENLSILVGIHIYIIFIKVHLPLGVNVSL